ncbi:fimbrial biogenesis chaperone [Xanthomonas maliensis]|uniref:fimbrial biogenesis chaperone n=1 Tax=Xanthomonas maliensis TaxID=1321368 RepID=UPI0003A77946|nr:fimbria/pilus periplasmic chaperone [Xanthomonas maliensis]KAB7762312.1 pilus assembly protein [Xanthomonas maliensis]
MAARRRRWHAICLACVLVAGPGVAAEIAIAPITALIAADSTQTSTWVYNQGSTPWQAEARLYRWRQVDGRDVLEPATTATVSPQRFEIPANSRQLLRLIRLSPAPSQQEDSYRLVVTQDGTNGEPTLLRYSTPVFIQPSPPADVHPRLHARLLHEGGTTVLTVSNSGQGHARLADLTYLGNDGSRRSVREALAGYVLPGQSRRWVLPAGLPLADGRFVARINGDPESMLALDP